LETENPYLTVMAFPCTAWSGLNNFVKDKRERAARQKAARAHLDFCRRVVAHRVQRGRHVLLENPLCSQAWKVIMDTWRGEPFWNKLIWVRCDQCTVNLRDSNGDLILEPTRFVTTAVCVWQMPSTCDVLEIMDMHPYKEDRGVSPPGWEHGPPNSPGRLFLEHSNR
jgi:hypothetical protein